MNVLEICLTGILLLLFFVPSKHVNDDNSYLSISNTIRIKGWLSLGIVFHHIVQEIYYPNLHWGLGKIGGILFTAVFLFFNGYGTMHSLIINPNYLEGFLGKRMLKILFPFIVIYFLYVLVNIILGESYSILYIVKSLFNGALIAYHLWYLEFLLLYYAVFYLMGKITPNLSALIISIVVFLFFWLGFTFWRKFSVQWYISCFSLPIGMVFAYKNQDINIFLHKFKSIIILICLIILVCCRMQTISFIYTTYLGIALAMASAVSFNILFLLLNTIWQNKGNILLFLGKYSFELYMIHGLVMILLRNSYLYIKNDVLFAIGVLICSILLAVGLNKFFNNFMYVIIGISSEKK